MLGSPVGPVVKTGILQRMGYQFKPWSRKMPQTTKPMCYNYSACALEPLQCMGYQFKPWSRKMPQTTKPMYHNYSACALEPSSHNY